jgi:hypothetical protein
MFAKGPLSFNSRRAQSITKAIVGFIAKEMYIVFRGVTILLKGFLDYTIHIVNFAHDTINYTPSLTRPGLEPTIYRTGQEHAKHYTTNVVAPNDNRWTDIVMTTFSMYLN